jgi:hypothetical protein
MNYFKKGFFYFFAFFIALQITFITYYCVQLLQLPIPSYPYHESVALYFNGYKKSELIHYLIGVMVIGIWFAMLLLLQEALKRRTRFSFIYLFNRLCGRMFAILFFVLLPFLILVSGILLEFKIFASIAIAVLAAWLPVWFKQISRKRGINTVEAMLQKIKSRLVKIDFFKVLIVVGYVQLLVLFYEPIFQQIKIITEYWGIDEYTILDNNHTVGKHSYMETISNKIVYSPIEDDGAHFVVGEKKYIFNTGTSASKLTYDEKKFLKNNEFEVRWQTFGRFMIHHNSFVYVPVQEVELHKDSQLIHAQYGLGLTWIMGKIFSWSGGVSFDKWLRVSYSVYYAYFLIFLIVVHRLTRDWRFTAIIFLFSLSVVNSRGYDFLLLPPGESPWRHFFDLWVVWFLYSFGKTKNILYYWLALGFGIVSIIMNPQIGAMIFVPIVLIGVFFAVFQRELRWKISTASLVALALFSAAWSICASTDDLTMYYIDGVIGFSIPLWQLLFFLSLLAAGYALMLMLAKHLKNEHLLPLLFLFFYSQELFVYVVWHYNWDGLKSRAFIYILTAGLITYYASKTWTERLNKIVWGLLTAFALLVYTVSVVKVFKSKIDYDEIFKTHITYAWTMDKARFISTMNPAPFENGVNLIKKYSGNQNGIYIISEYDNLLPFLANRYSQMPFFDLKWYLITPREVDKTIQILQSHKPEYIFVDSNINRDYAKEIIDPKIPFIGYLYQESAWRVQRLMLLRQVFSAVGANYELVEKGALISVYKRKDANESH